MSAEPEVKKPKYLENSLLVLAGMLAHAPLWYQLPRWAKGLDPTFVHPSWIGRSLFPLLFYMAEAHPLVWMSYYGSGFYSDMSQLWLEIGEVQCSRSANLFGQWTRELLLSGRFGGRWSRDADNRRSDWI